MAQTVNPATEVEKHLVAQIELAVREQEAAMERMERLIANRRENAKEGRHYAELNIGTVAADIARWGQAAHAAQEVLDRHRSVMEWVAKEQEAAQEATVSAQS